MVPLGEYLLYSSYHFCPKPARVCPHTISTAMVAVGSDTMLKRENVSRFALSSVYRA